MSSSVFIESSNNSTVPKTTQATEVFDGLIGGSSADANLVVVYGKNGTSYDHKGLEKLIEEKTLSSISVIRLTSPTPSMEDEEEQAAKYENDSDDQSENSSLKDTINEEEDQYKKVMSNEEKDSDADADEKSTEEYDGYTSDGGKTKNKLKKSNKAVSAATAAAAADLKLHKYSEKRKRERPEIVGLTIEEFYPPEDANVLLKNVLKKAGLPTIKHSEYKFQLYVIQNDHCYTPFTSPEQMKAKLNSDKYLMEKQANVNRKIIPLTVTGGKQQIIKKKPISIDGEGKQKPSATMELSHNKGIKKDVRDKGQSKLSELFEDDEEVSNGELDDEEDYTESEISAETDNDRDSDLDFNVNNRKGSKRKVKLLKKLKRPPVPVKTQNKRRQQSQDDSDEICTTPQRAKGIRSTNSDVGRLTKTIITPPAKAAITSACIVQRSRADAIPTTPSIAKKQSTPTDGKILNSSSSPIITGVRRGPIVQVGTPTTSRNLQLQASPQTVKEIVINKVIASPKGGFTDISALLTQDETSLQTISSAQTPEQRSQSHTVQPSKGFMPLVIETAVKNQLPAQISIQTHQSSSELAAENDKQLDLIDSIVKDEMQKANVIEQAPSVNENIPELVKMLESTEKALVTNAAQQLGNFTQNNTVEEIDISNTPLLENAEDELPEDLLQHVVELIEDDKTLQEAVEKEVFGNNNSDAVVSTPPPLAPIFQHGIKTNTSNLQSTPKVFHSIANLSTNPPITPTVTPTAAGINTSKAVLPASARKEPIQIIRGNGRVITLPPIEAPTTRAKRRAQTQPTNQHDVSISSTLNESSLDNSLHSNASFGVSEISAKDKSTSDTATTAKQRASKEAAANVSTVSSKSGKKSAAKKKTTAAAAKAATENGSKNASEADASESQGDDDDPNKLWCICRQPHNNRFMICCDVCEDWFHGTCVSITKAMGLEMEQKGIDWTCPKCVKKLEEKKQPKITDMLTVKTTTTATPPTQSSKPKGVEQQEQTKKQIIGTKKEQAGQIGSAAAPKNAAQTKKAQTTIITMAQKKLFASSPITKSTPPPTNNQSTTQSQTKRIPVSQEQKTLHAKILHQQQNKIHKTASTEATDEETPCIVCKKVARVNSIYCSDDCIRKHAQNALNAFSAKSPETTAVNPHLKSAFEEKKKKAKGLFEDLLSMADRKPKVERVNVYERKTGRFLTGHSAPTTVNLKKWLQDNPTFEVVQPGSAQSIELEKKQHKHRLLNPASPPTTSKNLSIATDQNVASPAVQTSCKPLVTPLGKKNDESTTSHTEESPLPKSVKQLIEQVKNSPTGSRPGTPKHLQKYPQQVAIKPDKPSKSEATEDAKSKEKKAKRQNATTDSSSSSSVKVNPETVTPTNDSEPIRLNVRRTLKEQLIQRVNEDTSCNTNDGNNTKISTKLTPDEIEEFVTETEAEMYNFFNRDTGTKYKAKYRSLMFNIKDRKNHTLFAKICAKLVEPKQLVRMTPEELASQELAKWRENETKHQLEMIKKSELDMLSCAKNYVLKTHKGEEVIEEKLTKVGNFDLTIPEEDVASVLNTKTINDDVETNVIDSTAIKDQLHITESNKSSTYHTESHANIGATSGAEEVQSKPALLKEKDRDQDRERDRDYDRDRDRDRDRGHERRHKSKDRHREKSKSHRRSRSRSHSRSRSRSKEKRHKSSHKDDRDRERIRDKERREKERDHREGSEKSHSDKKASHSASSMKSTTGTLTTKEQSKHHREHPKKSTTPKPLEVFSLIDQILDSTKTVEEAANLVVEKEKVSTTTRIPSPTPSQANVSNPARSTSAHDIAESKFSLENDEKIANKMLLPTTSLDPYVHFLNVNSPTATSVQPPNIWSGNINMIDVASFQIVLQPVIGNYVNLGKFLPAELDVVGRIGPDTVWDYISKIKKSPNKEIVIIRLIPSNQSETAAYTILYQYLDKRKRLGVIKTTSSQIKDFYIYPLGAGKAMPAILQTTDHVEFYEDLMRPDILVGIVIRVTGKRAAAATPAASTTTSSAPKFPRKLNDTDSFTPPGSPKRRKRLHSVAHRDDLIDIDAIIKAPIAAKIQKPASASTTTTTATTTKDDADEPYSPGGSSDDDIPLLPMKSASAVADVQKTADDDLKRKMDELNRQIAAQEMEIAGLLNVEQSCYTSSSTTTTVLANISIPSNLSQILASIKSKPDTTVPLPAAAPTPVSAPPLMGINTRQDEDEEYKPEEFMNMSYKTNDKPSTSRLAQLSEAELLSMVPDDMIEETSINHPQHMEEKRAHSEEPPPPGV